MMARYREDEENLALSKLVGEPLRQVPLSEQAPRDSSQAQVPLPRLSNGSRSRFLGCETASFILAGYGLPESLGVGVKTGSLSIF